MGSNNYMTADEKMRIRGLQERNRRAHLGEHARREEDRDREREANTAVLDLQADVLREDVRNEKTKRRILELQEEKLRLEVEALRGLR